MVSPTVPPPRSSDLSTTLTRNIEALDARYQAERDARGWGERFADTVTNVAGSLPFAYLHGIVYGLWIVVNLGLVPGVPAFDKSFVTLATEASVEAIFLSTFVLISQNKMARSSDKRANLDLQVNLLAEHELTKVAGMVAAIMEHLGLSVQHDAEVGEITRDVAPEAVLDKLEANAVDTER